MNITEGQLISFSHRLIFDIEVEGFSGKMYGDIFNGSIVKKDSISPCRGYFERYSALSPKVKHEIIRAIYLKLHEKAFKGYENLCIEVNQQSLYKTLKAAEAKERYDYFKYLFGETKYKIMLQPESFLKQEFFSNPMLAPEVLNTLIQMDSNRDIIADMDNKQEHGQDYFYIEVFETMKTVQYLSRVVKSLELYKLYYNQHYPSDENSEIGLAALQDLHNKNHPKHQIRWDHNICQYIPDNKQM